MGQTLLVTVDIPLGHEVISALEAAGIKVNVALWAWLNEYEEWRLVIASRTLDKEAILQRHLLVNAATDAAGISVRRAPSILILAMTDPFIRELRRMYGKLKEIEGIRLGTQRFGERYISDGWVYRINLNHSSSKPDSFSARQPPSSDTGFE